MQVYKKILVTIDCSAVDEAIVRHAALLAQQNEATLTLLHIVHAHTLDEKRALTTNAGEVLKGHVETLQAEGIDCRSLVRLGEPGPEILDEIESGDYDLVAMATHGHRFVGDILFGSVSETLKHKIRVPLLLLRS